MRLFNNKISISSRLTVKKHVHEIITEHFHGEVPNYDIDIELLPRINFSYYGRRGNAFIDLTFSWLVWDAHIRWDDDGLPPKRVRQKQSNDK